MIDLGLYGTSYTASNEPERALTVESVLQCVRDLERVLDKRGAEPIFLGQLPVRVYESPLVEFLVPNRVHLKRRTQSEKYHQRIQKKWIKRFGRKQDNRVLMFSDPMFGHGIVASPHHFAMIKNIAGAFK